MSKPSIESQRERLDQRLKDNSDYQRRKQMTPEQRAREAKDRLSKNVHEHFAQQGKSSAEAERTVEKVVARYVRESE